MCNSSLPNTPWLSVLSLSADPKVADMEARAVCSRDKADLCGGFLNRETTRDADKAHQGGV